MPALSPSACLNRLAEADADVFDRVVLIDVQVALGADREVDHRVLRQQREHVVEEADAGGDVGLAGAVEIERERDLRLGGLAVDGGGAGHGFDCGLLDTGCWILDAGSHAISKSST